MKYICKEAGESLTVRRLRLASLSFFQRPDHLTAREDLQIELVPDTDPEDKVELDNIHGDTDCACG